MVRRTVLGALTVLLSVGLFAVGCGPEGGEKDAGGGGDDAGGMDTAVDTGTPDNDAGTGGDADAVSCQSCIRPEYQGGEAPSCGGGEAPDRCGKNPWDFKDWGAGSVITKFDLTSDEASECCFDLNYDGENDNALGGLLGLLGTLGDLKVNDEIKKSLIANKPYSDDLIFLMEHDGLSKLGQSNEYNLNFFLGTYGSPDATDYLKKKNPSCNIANKDCETTTSSGESFNIDPRSFEGGTQPQAQVPKASFPKSDTINAGPGTVALSISVPELGPITLSIRGATIDATVDTQKSDPKGDGIIITDGKLGGYVVVRDVLNLVDRLMKSCSCLEIGPNESGLSYPYQDKKDDPDLRDPACENENNKPDNCKIGCTSKVEMNANNKCGDASGICGFSGTVCSELDRIAGFADLDVDGDGGKDALSAGALFETVGANIEGVEAIIEAGDQKVSSGSVKASLAYLNQPGWVVLHKDDMGSPGDVIGTSSALMPGMHEDVSVNIKSSANVSSGDTVHVVLHKDAGMMGKFQKGKDTPIQSGLGNDVATSFDIQ